MNLRTKLAVALVVPTALSIATSLVVRRQLLESDEAEEWVVHTGEVLAAADDLVETSIDAESAERAYVLTGSPIFLARFHAKARHLDEAAPELARLVADSSVESARVASARKSLDEWTSRTRSAVLERDAPTVAAAERGGSIHDAEALATFRKTIAELVTHERAMLASRTQANDTASRNAATLAIAGPAAATLFALAVALLVALRIVRSAQSIAAAADALSRGDLRARATVGGHDELGAMALAFNAMADSLVERRRERLVLAKITGLLQACERVEEAYEVVARIVPELFSGASGHLLALNASRNTLSVVARFGDASGSPEGPFAPDDCWSLRRGHPHRALGGATAIACRHVASPIAAPTICLPLAAGGEPMGVLCIDRPEVRGGSAGDDGSDLAHVVAEQLALTWGTLALREKLRAASVRDALTGLFNRRYLEETLDREIERSARTQRPLGLLMVDADHFKRINDTLGHAAGDAVLREIGRLLSGAFRASDVACRYGGEEFVVVLPDASLENVVRRAEQLREAVRARAVPWAGESIAITVSIGAAVAPTHGTTGQALVQAADAAVYRAKRDGRDRVVTAS